MDLGAMDVITRTNEGSSTSVAARAIEVRGVVQGVGFRPFVWRLATRHALVGWVRNTGGVVEIHAEGRPAALDRFCRELRSEAPSLAIVEDVRTSPVARLGLRTFEIDASTNATGGDRLVSPDAATCPACLRELLDPDDRRFRYPFINCTECGPRFTIIDALPYDRERTSMRAFPMCPACQAEYTDPSDRRFHAEPIACPDCGPRLALLDGRGGRIRGDAIEEAGRLLLTGGIVAIKGLGGYHLACDATDEDAVAELRRRKRRPDKPFAVMVPELDDARSWFDVGADEAELLSSRRAPIVFVGDRGSLAPPVAPGHRRQGAMLPATPLHHLLLREIGLPLVMTSGNATDEPICIDDADALERLRGIADAYLVHDRQIVARYDDPVARVWRGAPVVVRRARGFAPSSLELPIEVPAALGTGALLHGAFCLASGRRAFLSQHIGDLDTEEAMRAYVDALDRSKTLFGIEPELVAHDLHPDLATTRYAEETGLRAIAVQHHHAHVAAVMAEHRLGGTVIGFALDGFGLGTDGSIWGGEVFAADVAHAERLGHLRTVRQPGGDAAVRQPWRMAFAHALDAGVEVEAIELLEPRDRPLAIVRGQLRSGMAAPWTSSAGRLFDAVAALTGVCAEASYEGQPAMLLEQASVASAVGYPVEIALLEGRMVVDTRPIVAGVVADLIAGVPVAEVGGRFHRTLALAIGELAAGVRDGTGLSRVCLGGGVFQNDLLLTQAVEGLEADGFEVFVPREVPAGDGGIALGQVLVAGARGGGER
jgi:hydrogenase maturation protein HypF